MDVLAKKRYLETVSSANAQQPIKDKTVHYLFINRFFANTMLWAGRLKKSNMDLQTFLDNKVKALRQQTLVNSDQLTLGELIAKIEAVVKKGYKCHDGSEPTVRYDFEYLFPTTIDSWRGSYAELALNFETSGEELPVSKFLELLKSAVGKTFEGYKGGDFAMDENTPIWVANYSHSGNTAVVDVLDCDYQVILVTGYREY